MRRGSWHGETLAPGAQSLATPPPARPGELTALSLLRKISRASSKDIPPALPLQASPAAASRNLVRRG